MLDPDRHPPPPGPKRTRREEVRVLTDVLKGVLYEMSIDDPLAAVCAVDAVADFAHLTSTVVESELLAHQWDAISTRLLELRVDIENAIYYDEKNKP